MSMTVDELEGVSLVMAQHMETLSNSILNEIIDRIKEGQTISRTTDYLIWRYSQIYGFNEKVKEFIAEATGLMEEELERIFGEVLEKGYARDEELYTAAGKEQIPFEENTELQQYISAVKKQTKDELTNITGTTGYMVNVNGQKVYTPTSYTLQRALDKGVNEVIEGVKDANTAVKEVIKELTDSGLRTVDYATGKRLTVESAARMCVMTGLGQVTGKIEEQNMDSLETPYVEVSWHATARPSHQVWQGRVFYWKEKDKNPTPPEKKEVAPVEGAPKNETYNNFGGLGIDNSQNPDTMKALRGVRYKTGGMPPDEYARAKKLWNECDEVEIPQSEKEHVYEELDNNLSARERKMAIVRRSIGNYTYTVINMGHNQYKIIDYKPIEWSEDDDIVYRAVEEAWRETT